MFERYLESARRVIFFARHEASQYGSETIEPHHLLLAILREAPAVAPEALRNAYSLGELRARFEKEFRPPAKVSGSVDLPLSDASRRILAYAAEESDRRGHKYIGPEHLLLGTARESHSPAAGILREYGFRVGDSREQLASKGVRTRDEIYRQVSQLPEDRLAAASRVLDALSAAYGTIQAETADGRFAVSFGKPPANV